MNSSETSPLAATLWRRIWTIPKAIKWKLKNNRVAKWFRNFHRARRIAILDKYLSSTNSKQFQRGTRPVIRWIKGDGLDDKITQAAILQATRLFGDEVDYCLVTQGIGPERAREVLSWAEQSVEWWPITEADNPALAKLLKEAGCPKEDFGYWWKWFPDRVRINAPEWILDGDMLVVGRPEWFDQWKSGKDAIRVTENPNEHFYGEYASRVDLQARLYSGLISLPPKIDYMERILELLRIQPLAKNHNGRVNPSEQGVIATVFQKMSAVPIPLTEFPFAQADLANLIFGSNNSNKLSDHIWGYHFTKSFVMQNPHFERLISEGVIPSKSNIDPVSKYQWLSGGNGQWGLPGWGMANDSLKTLIDNVISSSPGSALELGTSRGRIAAVLAEIGFKVTTVDPIDRGAAINLKGLGVTVHIGEAIDFLAISKDKFNIIVIDVHDNSINMWGKLWPLLAAKLEVGGKILINNLNLAEIDGWNNEKGVKQITKELNENWNATVLETVLPGIIMLEGKA
jgi:hypothetical protein